MTRWDYLQRRLAYGMIQAGTLKNGGLDWILVEGVVMMTLNGYSVLWSVQKLIGTSQCHFHDFNKFSKCVFDQ